MTTPHDQTAALAQLRIDRPQGAARRRRPWAWWLVLAALVAAGLAWFLMPHALVVQTTPVVSTTASQQYVDLTASGYVVAQRRAAVASKATGRLVQLNVREGSRVRQGDVIARLDASDVQAAMAAAQAGVRQAEAGLGQAQVELVNAQAELTRSKGLQAQGFISPQAVDTVQTRARAAQASVQSAQAAIKAAQAQVHVQQVNEDFTAIRAPFDGVVLVKNANVGDIITPFSNAAGSQGAVVTMADMRTLEVEVDVSEGSLGKVRVGQPVEILLDALPGLRFKGAVGGIVPTVDRAKATVMTKVRFDALDPRVLPEMSAKVNFLTRAISPDDQRSVLAVPKQALVTGPKGPSVWRVVTTAAGALQADPVPVKQGPALGELVEVQALGGAPALKAGDKLVLQAPTDLKAGAAVKLAQP